MANPFEQFETKIGVLFVDKSLLKQAFTHRSYINEHPDAGIAHNERLEFLGDAVLELAVTEFLFKKYPRETEGDLTAYRAALVNTNTLAAAAARLDMNAFLLLSRGEAKDEGRARTYILANTFEAVIGAIYLDKGYGAAERFIAGSLFHLTEDIVKRGLWQDAKSKFQEEAQERESVTPAYQVLRESGPDHDKRFTVGVFLGTQLVAEAEGLSKQEAEQNAAAKALTTKGWAAQ